MKADVAKKVGRRAAGSYGRVTGKWGKRAAAKAVRRTVTKQNQVKYAA